MLLVSCFVGCLLILYAGLSLTRLLRHGDGSLDWIPILLASFLGPIGGRVTWKAISKRGSRATLGQLREP